MSLTTQAYDKLPSETASASNSIRQRDSQLCGAESDPPSACPNPKHLSSAYIISRLWASWKWEFLACVLVMATPIIILATLSPYSGRPLPQWPFKYSINSLISVYALVLKAVIGFILTSCIGQLQWTWFSETRPLADMLHFDSATRGADGALGLIWRQRFRQPLTSLGCIILVLAVAVDPFVQQLIRPVDCSTEVTESLGHATLPRANVVVRGSSYHEVENALEDGSFNFSPVQEPPWHCSTGNCTFPDTYGTIGLCYSCRDISTNVNFNATCSGPGTSYVRHFGRPITGEDCPESSSFTIRSSYTQSYDVVLNTSIEFEVTDSSRQAVVASANSILWPSIDNSSRTILPRRIQFGFLMGATASPTWFTSNPSACGSHKSWRCQDYGAATCFLQPCVQLYDSTISAGYLEERLLESSLDTQWGAISDDDGNELWLALIDTHCSAKVQTPTNTNSSMESRWLPYNLMVSIESVDDGTSPSRYHRFPNDTMRLLENGCLYLIETTNPIRSFARHLNGTIKARTDWQDDRSRTLSNFEGPHVIKSIYNSGETDLERVKGIMTNISNVLTTYMRTHGGSPQVLGSGNFSKSVQGKVYRYATCLEVQWPWLSFPTFLSILTLVFFLTVVGTTATRETSVWKASPLAWVLRAEGLGDGLLPSPDGSCETMKERSAQIAVRLFDEDPDGPRIRMADLKDPNML